MLTGKPPTHPFRRGRYSFTVLGSDRLWLRRLWTSRPVAAVGKVKSILFAGFSAADLLARFGYVVQPLEGTKLMAKKKAESKQEAVLELQPLADRVVVEREESEETTPGGIVLPDTAKKRPARGTVVSVGQGRLLDDGTRAAMQVKVGDRVIFSSYAGDDFKVGERELVLLREDDILAVVE